MILKVPADSSLKLIDIWLLHGILMPMVVFTILINSQIMESSQSKKNPRPEPSNKGATDEKLKSCIVEKKNKIAEKRNVKILIVVFQMVPIST